MKYLSKFYLKNKKFSRRYLSQKFQATIPKKISFLLFLFLSQIISADKLPNTLIKGMKNQKYFTTFRSDIEQKISETGKKTVTYKGIFLADSKGRIRVDFFKPEPQSIIYNLKNLYWIFYQQKHIWKISNKNTSSFLPSRPGQNLMEFIKKYNIEYKGIVQKRKEDCYHLQFFSSQNADNFSDNDYSGELFISKNWFQALNKILYNKKGLAFYIEEFSNFTTIKQVNIARRIRVQIKKNNIQVLNDTRYSNIQINMKIPEYYFKLKTPKHFTIDDYKY